MKFPTQLCGSFFNKPLYTRIPINQPVFQCNIGGFCVFFVAQLIASFCCYVCKAQGNKSLTFTSCHYFVTVATKKHPRRRICLPRTNPVSTTNPLFWLKNPTLFLFAKNEMMFVLMEMQTGKHGKP